MTLNKIIEYIIVLVIVALFILFPFNEKERIIKLEADLSALTRLVTIQDSLLIKAIEEECK